MSAASENPPRLAAARVAVISPADRHRGRISLTVAAIVVALCSHGAVR